MERVSWRRAPLAVVASVCAVFLMAAMLLGCGTNTGGGTSGNLKATLQPSSGKQGSRIEVKIVGSGTNFIKGNTRLGFTSVDPTNPDVKVISTTVSDETHATAVITIAADAKTGNRMGAVTTTSTMIESAPCTLKVLKR